jgi:adenylate kinase
MSETKPPKIIIAGAPASGKGTQCEMLVEKFGVVHISTGDALRAEVEKGSELGAKAKECMDAGALVPDDLIIGIVKERLAQEDCQKNGWLLDGFPRTGAQAEALAEAEIVPTHFVLLDVPDDILVERCEGRRSDPETGKIYHIKFNPPPEDPEVQARLIHRSDDTAEAMGKRITMYHENVSSIIGNYKHICQAIKGTNDKMEIAAEIANFIENGRVPPKVIIAGAPASGKGTQCELIVERFGVVHISTGDALRAEVEKGSELGAKAKECMDAGALVPDDLIINIVKERLAQEDCQKNGWLLDGFPRTGAQAEALATEGVVATHFVLLDVPDDILVERCEGRRSDPETGKIYHLKFNPPPEDEEIQARLVHRSDDTAEAMGKRITMYHENVSSIIGNYEHISKKFDGTRDKAEIAKEVAQFLMHPVEAKAEEVVREKTPPPPEPETMKIIIAGAPASGKGTQCELIVEKYGVVHISTGDALRAEVLKGSELGAKAKECMDAGALVPDDLIINIVKERLAQEDCQKNGWLLDGFPRTGVQADELKSSGIVPTHFVLLDVPEGILVERCEGRRSDPETGKIYHLKFNPPPKEVVPRLVHRSDDTAEAMGKRIAMYKDNVNSVVGNYEGIMRRFNGSKDKSAIFADVAAFLDGAPRPEAPKTRKVMICGAPASGKGTQCDGIVSDFGLVHISTGDELRMHVRQGTPLGVLAKKYMDDGALVPDSLMVEIVKERLGHMDVYEKGWLLDGFPRTGAQVRYFL